MRPFKVDSEIIANREQRLRFVPHTLNLLLNVILQNVKVSGTQIVHDHETVAIRWSEGLGRRQAAEHIHTLNPAVEEVRGTILPRVLFIVVHLRMDKNEVGFNPDRKRVVVLCPDGNGQQERRAY